MNRIMLCAALFIASCILSTSAEAQQYVVRTPQGEKVVHTRLAPVVVHRVFPPYLGKHVYQGRLR